MDAGSGAFTLPGAVPRTRGMRLALSAARRPLHFVLRPGLRPRLPLHVRRKIPPATGERNDVVDHESRAALRKPGRLLEHLPGGPAHTHNRVSETVAQNLCQANVSPHSLTLLVRGLHYRKTDWENYGSHRSRACCQRRSRIAVRLTRAMTLIIAIAFVNGCGGSGAPTSPSLPPPPSGAGLACGVERWFVKTLADADASRVNVNTVTPISIRDLNGFATHCSGLPENRAFAEEFRLFEVVGRITFVAHEDDRDSTSPSKIRPRLRRPSSRSWRTRSARAPSAPLTSPR